MKRLHQALQITAALATASFPISLAAQHAPPNPFEGRTITLTISCERAGTGTIRIQPKSNGAIDYFFNGFLTPIRGGSGPNGYTSSMTGNTLIIHQNIEGLAGVSFNQRIEVNANSCTAVHTVEPGEHMDSIDPTCRATRCIISPQPRPTTPAPSATNPTKPTTPAPSPPTIAKPPVPPSAPTIAKPTVPPSAPTVAKPTVPTPSTPVVTTPSCGSTITGGNLAPPAPRDKCDNAKKWLTEARSARKSWFGSKDKAEPLYKQAAQVYRDAGDLDRAELTIEESKADDVTVYEQTERDAEQRPQNLKEAENLKDIARKIERGAYESKSCGDLLKAADYYFQSARMYLKANEFKATNSLLLRHDELVAIVDDAKKRGVCDGKVEIKWTSPPSQRDTPHGGNDYCKRMAKWFDREENQKRLAIAAYKIQVAPTCKGIVEVNDRDCRLAYIHWMDLIPREESARKRKDAGCKVG